MVDCSIPFSFLIVFSLLISCTTYMIWYFYKLVKRDLRKIDDEDTQLVLPNYAADTITQTEIDRQYYRPFTSIDSMPQTTLGSTGFIDLSLRTAKPPSQLQQGVYAATGNYIFTDLNERNRAETELLLNLRERETQTILNQQTGSAFPVATDLDVQPAVIESSLTTTTQNVIPDITVALTTIPNTKQTDFLDANPGPSNGLNAMQGQGNYVYT